MKKRNTVAAVFMAAAIAASVPLGINRSLVRLRDDAGGEFYYDQAGYSICDGLEKRREAAGSLVTLAERYSESNPELESLIDALDYRVKASENAWSGDYTFNLEARANAAMDAPAQALAQALNSAGLSEKDQKYPDQLIQQMKSEQDKINRSSYNDAARDFNAKIERLSPIAMVEPMADFSAVAEEVPADEPAVEYAGEDAFERSVDQWADSLAESVERGADSLTDEIDRWADDFADEVEQGVDSMVDRIVDRAGLSG